MVRGMKRMQVEFFEQVLFGFFMQALQIAKPDPDPEP
jgi:hypothetical protein